MSVKKIGKGFLYSLPFTIGGMILVHAVPPLHTFVVADSGSIAKLRRKLAGEAAK